MASDDKSVEIAAVRLLARREHGTQELKRKLAAKGHDPDAIERVVAKLGAKRLVSDDRFVAVFVHHHAKRGQGPVRIRAELRQQGIPDDSIDRAFLNAGLEWDQLAAQARRRKFTGSPPKTLAERAKQSRFLQYRGFTADQIRTAVAGKDGDQPSSDQTDSLDSDWSD